MAAAYHLSTTSLEGASKATCVRPGRASTSPPAGKAVCSPLPTWIQKSGNDPTGFRPSMKFALSKYVT